MKVMKATCAAILVCLTPTINAKKLTHPILKRLDGIFIKAERIKDLLHIRRELNNRLKGHKTRSSKVRIGHYTFHESSYTLQELSNMEKELDRRLHEAKKINDETATQLIESSIDAMNELLEYVKDDLFEVAGPFLGPASAMKTFAIPLIKESCQNHGHPNSMLLEWEHIPHGKEIETFKEKIQSFTQVLEFCTDLANYLIDMVESTPKAFAMFKKVYLRK